MTPEERSLLERTYKIAQENNEILRKMRSVSRWATAFKVFYWVVILGLSFGAFYAIQPYMNQVLSMYSEAQSNIQTIKGLSDKVGGLVK